MLVAESYLPSGSSSDDRVARAERADALIARLESRIAHDAAQRAALLGSVATLGLVEPHRSHHAYALGADQADCELASGDARALRGLMSVGPAKLADLLDAAAGETSGIHVTRLWPQLIDTDRAGFDRRGAAVDTKRLAAGGTSGDQRTVFEAALARTSAAHGHRDEVAFVLGADLFWCGLFAADAVAMLGLMSIGPARLADELRAVASNKAIYVARLWPALLARHREDYEARGAMLRWQRRWARYRIDFEAWLTSSRRADEDWREKPMTSRQRHMVRDTALVLQTSIPENMSCGAAHDWLLEIGANTLYRKEL